MTIGEKIQKLRKRQGLSQEELAEKVTVTRQTISKWELGRSTPDLDFIAQLSDIFNVSADYLIKDEMTEPDELPYKKRGYHLSERSKRVILVIVSATALIADCVCLICDYFTSDRLSWSLPIFQLTFYHKSSLISHVEYPELFHSTGNDISYSRILSDLERRYSNATEPLCICGLSLGSLLALDFTIRHGNKVASLVLIGAQYKVPTLLIDFQNLLFHCMPGKCFDNMGLSKSDTIKLSHSMRSLDFTSQLNRITCPVAILCGEKDSANLKASKKLNELLPQSTLHIIPGAGHEVNKDAPETIAAILNG